MASCSRCSAPLPANSQICRYCGVRNDIDLRGKHDYRVMAKQSSRLCPHCRISLQTIQLDFTPALHIERCNQCYGLFFDPGEVERLLENAVSPVLAVNHELIGSINEERYRKEQVVKYIKCPVCEILMNRVVFGHRSGVVVDRCKSHGVWLDGGEVSHLLEWKRAGGQLLHDKKVAQKPQSKWRREPTSTVDSSPLYGRQHNESELFESVASLVFSLFE